MTQDPIVDSREAHQNFNLPSEIWLGLFRLGAQQKGTAGKLLLLAPIRLACFSITNEA